MTEREKVLLMAIIAEHIRFSKPVGSKVIAEKYLREVSSATIRNDMSRLEQDGLIEQPHTSAGRVPTAKAYKYYVENSLKEKTLSKSIRLQLEKITVQHKNQFEILIRELAKGVAGISSEAVIVGFSPRDVYYTGLSNLFRQPEFEEIDLVQNFSEVIDKLDEVMEQLFPQVAEDIQIMVGQESPFGPQCGVLVTKYQSRAQTGMFGILGPVRMPYEENQALLKYTKELLSK